MVVSNYKRLLTAFHGYRLWFILSAFLNIIIAGGTLAIPALSDDLID